MRLEEQFYRMNDLENLSATELYTGHLPKMGSGGFGLPKLGDSYGVKSPIFKTPLMNSNSIGSVSEFKPASNFGLGPGIAKIDFGFLERYRAGEHENYGKDHVNLDIISPVTGKHLLDLHIKMDNK